MGECLTIYCFVAIVKSSCRDLHSIGTGTGVLLIKSGSPLLKKDDDDASDEDETMNEHDAVAGDYFF